MGLYRIRQPLTRNDFHAKGMKCRFVMSRRSSNEMEETSTIVKSEEMNHQSWTNIIILWDKVALFSREKYSIGNDRVIEGTTGVRVEVKVHFIELKSSDMNCAYQYPHPAHPQNVMAMVPATSQQNHVPSTDTEYLECIIRFVGKIIVASNDATWKIATFLQHSINLFSGIWWHNGELHGKSM
ncbi:hypothetical protein M0804_006739 [Polistes exclamans]|nr:hypothetical protein M0804_006739 [Polistes exclamans]